mmetsp:Transcript_16459/g.27507  ORF Transcript_16459/g.27507 Transcript_16459/m.27507 type:complete len:430 (-) Transcript_16459:91-1380(-)
MEIIVNVLLLLTAGEALREGRTVTNGREVLHHRTRPPTPSPQQNSPSYKTHEVNDNPGAFWHTFDKYDKTCTSGGVNAFKHWHSKDDFVNMSTYEWSVDSGLLHTMLGVNHGLISGDNTANMTAARVDRTSNVQPCTTVEDVALLFAELVGDESLVSGRQRCRLLWFDPLSYCSLFAKFAGVFIEGDSITRHMMQGLHMIGSQNWLNGAYPCRSASIQRENCHCDKQFSEIWACRSRCDYNKEKLLGEYIRERCQRTKLGNLQTNIFSYNLRNNLVRYARTCESLDGKLYVFTIQGSGHYATDPLRIINELLKFDIATVESWFRHCPEQLLIIYTGATVSSTKLQEEYPQQRIDKIEAFNVQVKAWLADNHPRVVFLDPFNVTRVAMSPPAGSPRSSDGYHFLSDFNILFANTLLNLMHTFSTNSSSMA